MSSLYYFGYYTYNSNPNDFKVFPGCNVKISYILNCIKINNLPVNVISLGESYTNKSSKNFKVDELENNYFVATCKGRIFSRLFLILQVLYILFFKVKKSDVVIFYHVFYLLPIFKFAKYLKKFKLIIEVEESYQAAWGNGDEKIKKEIELLKNADGYIYVNDLLPNVIEKGKFYTVCYGNYSVYLRKKVNYTLKKIRMVYAGLINFNEHSDVVLAINTMQYLSDRYSLSIAGYGSKIDINLMNEYIQEKGLSDKVSYAGFFQGQEYDEYLTEFDIGLNPRMLQDQLSNYTFPSKVMSYLTHGLYVVSTPIQCIAASKVANLVSLSNDNTAESLSSAVLKINFDCSHHQIIDELHNNFVKDIGELIKNASH